MNKNEYDIGYRTCETPCEDIHDKTHIRGARVCRVRVKENNEKQVKTELIS
jgi:hypothetical protein